MKLRCMAAVVAMVAVGVLSAAEKTIYVNLETLFDGYYKTVSANLSFEDSKQKVEDQLALMGRELSALNEEAKKLDGEMRNELLSKEVREASARKLQACVERLRAKNRECEKARQEAYQGLQRLRGQREEELVREILEVIDKLADEMQATHVIEVSGKTLNRVVVYLRYPKEAEVTDEVMKRLNVGHEEDLKAAQAELERRRTAAEGAKGEAQAPEAK